MADEPIAIRACGVPGRYRFLGICERVDKPDDVGDNVGQLDGKVLVIGEPSSKGSVCILAQCGEFAGDF